MYLKPAGIDTNTFDCFLGEGWDNWSRVKIGTDGVPVVIAGLALNSHFRTHIQHVVSSLFNRDLRTRKRK